MSDPEPPLEVGRMEVERRWACPHCRKLLPEFHPQEIVEAHEYPLRCPECRQTLTVSSQQVDAARRKLAGS